MRAIVLRCDTCGREEDEAKTGGRWYIANNVPADGSMLPRHPQPWHFCSTRCLRIGTGSLYGLPERPVVNA